VTTRDWDAATYDRVSDVQEEWGREVVARLELDGGETVLDAGCGTGRVTRALIERLPAGRVIAVDASAAMVEKAGGVLRPGDEAIVADLTELELAGAVDAILSTAVFHWIRDHDVLFRHLYAALRPGGVMEAQCGGEGNIAAFHAAARRVADQEPYAAHFRDWRGPWNFSPATTAAERLQAAGFEEVHCWLEEREARPEDARSFLRSVCLGPHLAELPPELRDAYLDDVLREAGDPLVLDYVRLNISARRA
jgi:trans-aconitate 2-methyltransferase